MLKSNDQGHIVYDPHRFQSRVFRFNNEFQEIKNLRRIVHTLDPKWKIKEMRFLKSLPGGEEQQVHQDYLEEEMDGNAASFIVSFDDNTKIETFDGSFKNVATAKKKTIRIPSGFCLFFRGDLLHHGSSFTSENRRLHGKLVHEGAKTKGDDVQLLGVPLCDYCRKPCPSSNHLAKHKYECVKNPKHQERLEQRRKRRKRSSNKEESHDV